MTRQIICLTGLILLMFSCGHDVKESSGIETASGDTLSQPKWPEDPQRTEAEAKALIDSLHLRLLNGEDFATLANQYSEDPGTNQLGGEYDSVRKDMFVPEFEKVVFNLDTNEISEPFKTEYGYHIAQVIAVRNEERDVRHILVRFKK